MKINLKKVSLLAIILFIFLSPVSIEFTQTQSENLDNQTITVTESLTDITSPKINVVVNQANALSVRCDSSAWNFVDTAACGIGNVFLTIWEFTIFYLTQVIVVLVGIMLDVFLMFSIDGNFYRSGIIEIGWEILRDFTNIIFIFALLMIAFKMVLGSDSSKVKQTLVKTILVALVINFSLFFTYAIIDVSNVLAYTFYNKIEQNSAKYETGEIPDNNTDNENPNQGGDVASYVKELLGDDFQSVSLAVASGINPQKIINASGTSSFAKAYIIVTTAGILNILMIWVFASIMLLFVGRSLGLMLLGITAPLAFATLVIPGMQDIQWIGFNKWFKQLLTLSFMAPIYVFLMYLIIVFLGDNVLIASIGRSGNGFLSEILNVYMLFFIIAGLLMLAKKITTSLAGELGGILMKSVQGLTGALVAGAAIAATGGAAALGGGMQGLGALTGSKKLAGAGKRLTKGALSFKTDVTQLPGFEKLTGKTATGFIRTVTNKSAKGHLLSTRNKMQKDKGNVFGDDTEKYEKEYTDKAIKDADIDAKAAKAKAEADKSAEIYQQQINTDSAQEKPDYIKATENLKDSMDALSNEEEKLTKLQKEQNTILNNPNASSAEIKAIGYEINDALVKIEEFKDDVYYDNEKLKATDGFKEEEKLENLKSEQTTAGEKAATASRKKAAAKYQNNRPDISQRIIDGEPGKDDKVSIEDVKKYMENLEKK